MDGQHFDELVKTLAAQTSRRGALRGLFAVALGGGLGLGRLARADAARCKPGKKCDANTQGAGPCGDAGLVCENGRFACPTVANATASFTHGACQYACQAGFADCDGDILSNGCEVDTNDDPDNCGACDHHCEQTGRLEVVCEMGSCHEVCGGNICQDNENCYVTCIQCGCFRCDRFGNGCGSYHEFCCEGGDPEACLGLRACPTDTQRFIELV